MQYEDIVYKAGILAMAVRLEEFLRKDFNIRDRNASLGMLVQMYSEVSQDTGVLAAMRRIHKARTDCAHPSNILSGENEFRDARDNCAKLDEFIAPNFLGSPARPGDVMISCSLRYDMGNAGDIIKHGILAEFTEWWCRCNSGKLRYADPFGGRPWGDAKIEAAKRVKFMHQRQRALGRAQMAERQLRDLKRIATYYGSSHVVLNAAQGRATVFADDADKLAQADLKKSGLDIISEDGELFPGYRSGDGYAILDHVKGAELDLVLIDPYREFMRDEFLVPAAEKRFSAVVKAVKDNPNLWIAVFVLDWRDTEQKYKEFRKRLAGRAIGLRCEPLKGGKLDGESSYAMEMLLVSDRLRPERCGDTPGIRSMLNRVERFEKSVSIPGGKVTRVKFDEM